MTLREAFSSRIFSIIALAILAFIPGSNATLFNGLPLSPLELLFFFALIALVGNSTKQQPSKNISYVVVIIFLIFIKLAGIVFLPIGWSVCLQREIAQDTLTTPCEPSSQNRSGTYTYIYPDINFANNHTPLHFFNELTFNYSSDEEQDRHSLPYTFTASTTFHPKEASDLHLATNTSNTYVVVNGEKTAVPFDTTLTIPLIANAPNSVTIQYTTHHSDTTSLSVDSGSIPFFKEKHASDPIVFLYQGIFIGGLGLLAILGLKRALFLIRSLPAAKRGFLLFSFAVTIMLYFLPQFGPPHFALGIFGLTFFYCLYAPHERAAVRPFFLLLLVSVSLIFTSTFLQYDELIILEGGNDPLSHEAHARIVATSESVLEVLQAGESSVFYYQPLYRYLGGTTHILLGESLWGIYLLQTIFLALTVSASAIVLFSLGGFFAVSLLAIGTTYIFTVEHSWPILAATTYQESLALSFIMLAFLMTLRQINQDRQSFMPYLGIGLLLGAAIMTRNDLLPALGFLPIALIPVVQNSSFFSKLKKPFTALSIGLTIFPAFIIFRNIITTGIPALFTSSSFINLIPALQNLFTSPNDFSIPKLIFRFIRLSLTNPADTLLPVWENIHQHIIGPLLWQEAGWGLLLSLSIITILSQNKNHRIISSMTMALIFFPLLVSGLFIQDNALATTSQYQYFLIFGLSLFISLLVERQLEHLKKSLSLLRIL